MNSAQAANHKLTGAEESAASGGTGEMPIGALLYGLAAAAFEALTA